ncbi:MAG: TolB family protein [Actinomycetota bacterium]
MNLDERGRRAAGGIRRAVGEPDAAWDVDADPFERFERTRRARRRGQRVASGVVAIAVAAAATVFVVTTLTPSDDGTPAAGALPPGTILYGEWDQRTSLAHWYTIATDGSQRMDLGIDASCASWFPDGNRILVTNDAEFTPTSPLRPAVIEPDGSSLRLLDAVDDPDLNLGCGDVSPDGTRIVLEGFGNEDNERNGIYSVRASDGGGLVRLTTGFDGPPSYSPDGSQVVFMRTRPGIQPDGAGALFVVNAGGGRPVRITPWGTSFLDNAWSPDGEWIAFQRPYGQLFLVHPDGSRMHRVPLELPEGAGARQASWSPDGDWIVFSMQQDRGATIWAVRPDGSDLQPVTTPRGVDETSPSWTSTR